MERVWWVSYGLAWVLVSAQLVLLVALCWVVGRIHLKYAPEAHVLITDEGPLIHSELPAIEGRDTTGRWIRSSDYRGRQLALLLLGPECPPCEQLAGSLPATRRGLFDPPEFLVVLAGTRSEADEYVKAHRLGCPVIGDEDGTIRQQLQVDRTPYGFLVDGGGVIRMKGVVNDRWQLEALVSRRGQYLGGVFWDPNAAASTESAVAETV
jgi:methylamine dehydrogenase accessory protein MauD